MLVFLLCDPRMIPMTNGIGIKVALLKQRTFVGVIGDEDTVTGLLLAGVGNIDNTRKSNFMVVDSSSTVTAIEQAFHDLTTRKDIAIVLITQNIADEIRHLLDGYSKPLPAVLEIPSKDMPYNPSKDSILKRAQKMFSVD